MRKKITKNNEDWNHFLRSMMRNNERWVYSSRFWLSSHDILTFFFQLLLPRVRESLAAKLECREIHERIWVFLETFLIVNMIDEILKNYTIIQEICQHHRKSLMMSEDSEERRNWEYWERRTSAINRFTLLFSKSEEKTSRKIVPDCLERRNSERTWYKIEFGKENGNQEALSQKVNLMSEILARPVLRNNLLRKPSRQAGCTSKVAWNLARKYVTFSRTLNYFLFSCEGARETEHRTFIVYSGASMHNAEQGKLRSDTMDTLRRSKTPICDLQRLGSSAKKTSKHKFLFMISICS